MSMKPFVSSVTPSNKPEPPIDFALQDRIKSLISRCERFNLISAESTSTNGNETTAVMEIKHEIQEPTCILKTRCDQDYKTKLKETNDTLNFEASKKRQLYFSYEREVESPGAGIMNPVQSQNDELDYKQQDNETLTSLTGSMQTFDSLVTEIIKVPMPPGGGAMYPVESRDAEPDHDQVKVKSSIVRYKESNFFCTKSRPAHGNETSSVTDFKSELHEKIINFKTRCGQDYDDRINVKETHKKIKFSVSNERPIMFDEKLMKAEAMLGRLKHESSEKEELTYMMQETLMYDLNEERENRMVAEEIIKDLSELMTYLQHGMETALKNEAASKEELNHERQRRLFAEEIMPESEQLLNLLKSELQRKDELLSSTQSIFKQNFNEASTKQNQAGKTIDEMKLAIGDLNAKLAEKGKAMSSMESIFKDNLTKERERSSAAERIMSELKVVIESLQEETKTKLDHERNLRLLTEQASQDSEQVLDMLKQELQKKDELLSSSEAAFKQYVNEAFIKEEQVEKTVGEMKSVIADLEVTLAKKELVTLSQEATFKSTLCKERTRGAAAEKAEESLQRRIINDEQDYRLMKLRLINDADKECERRLLVENSLKQMGTQKAMLQKEFDQERQRLLLTEQALQDSVEVADCLKNEIQKNKQLFSSAEAAFTKYLDESSKKQEHAENKIDAMKSVIDELNAKLTEREHLLVIMEAKFKDTLSKERERCAATEKTVESLQEKISNDEQDYLLKKLMLINDADKECERRLFVEDSLKLVDTQNSMLQKELDQERQRRLLTEQALQDSVEVVDCLKNEIQKTKELLSSAESAYTQYLYESSKLQEHAENKMDEMRSIVDELNLKLTEKEHLLISMEGTFKDAPSKECDCCSAAEKAVSETKAIIVSLEGKIKIDDQAYLSNELTLKKDLEQERERRLLIDDSLELAIAQKGMLQKKFDQERQNRLLTEQTLKDSNKIMDCLKNELQKKGKMLSSTKAIFDQHFNEASLKQEQAEKTAKDEMKSMCDDLNGRLAEKENVIAAMQVAFKDTLCKERKSCIASERTVREITAVMELFQEKIKNEEQNNVSKELTLMNDVNEERERRLLVEDSLKQTETNNTMLQNEYAQERQCRLLTNQILEDSEQVVDALKEEMEKNQELFSLTKAAFKQHVIEASKEQEQLEKNINELKSVICDLNVKLAQKVELISSMEVTFMDTRSNDRKRQKSTLQMQLQNQKELFDSIRDELEQARDDYILSERRLTEAQAIIESLTDKLESNEQMHLSKETSLVSDLREVHHYRLQAEESLEQIRSEHKILIDELMKKDELLSSLDQEHQLRIVTERYRLMAEESLEKKKSELEILKDELIKKDELRSSMEETLKDSIDQEHQLRILTEQYRLKAEKALGKKKSELLILKDELIRKDELRSSMEETLKDSLDQEHQLRILTEQYRQKAEESLEKKKSEVKELKRELTKCVKTLFVLKQSLQRDKH